MDQQHHELRRAAVQAFMESLDQLEEALQPVVDPPPTALDLPSPSASAAEPEPEPLPLDLAALEQAAADIEEFMQTQQASES